MNQNHQQTEHCQQSMKRAYVFGSSGFIGLQLCDDLQKLNVPIEKFERGTGATSQHHAIDFLKNYGNTLKETFESILQDHSIVYFLVPYTLPTHQSSSRETLNTEDVYLKNFEALIEVVSKKKSSHLVFVSSGGAIYGGGKTLYREDHPIEPKSVYGLNKLKCEALIQKFCHKNALSATIVRPSNAYGENQNPQKSFGAITTFFYRVKNSLPISIFGDLGITKDYIHVEDLSRGLVVLGENRAQGIYNLCAGKSHSLKEILDLVEGNLQKKATLEFYDFRPSDIYEYYLSNEKMKEEMKFQTNITLTEGVQRYLSQRQ